MSLTPETTPSPAAAPARDPAPPAALRSQARRLRQRLWAVLFAIFAFEIGAFLFVFPWLDSWTLNHLPSLFPRYAVVVQDLWDEFYFRAALSCLGGLDILIAVREVIRLVRNRS